MELQYRKTQGRLLALELDSNMLRRFAVVTATLVFMNIHWALEAQSQDQPAPELTDNELEAVNSIRERAVQATVAFLSSDEMAGRQTPSAELRIASRFAASRLQAAGLEPLGDDGTFFQTHSFEVFQPPDRTEVVLQFAQAEPAHPLGVLCVTQNRITIDAVVSNEKEIENADGPACAVIDELTVPPKARDNPSAFLFTLRRRVQALANKGVKLVLMKCEPNSVLVDVAHRLQGAPLPLRTGMQPDCAVVLVEKGTVLEGASISATIPPMKLDDVPVRNVVAVVRGSNEALSKEAIVVSAHLDHIGVRNFGADRIHNGADDNASGVTAVLTLADAFAELNISPKRSIVFTTFWGEEKGLMGSKAFVETPPWPLADIVANVNIEMVGRPENDAREKIWMTGWQHSNLGDLMRAGSQRIGVEVFDRKDVGEMLYKRSDNYSFVRKGVIAHSFSAGSLHADYHQPTDEWEKLDLPHMTKVIQGLFCGILNVANRSERPQ